MFNLIKDDFDESLEDIMNSVNKILENDEKKEDEDLGECKENK